MPELLLQYYFEAFVLVVVVDENLAFMDSLRVNEDLNRMGREDGGCWRWPTSQQ